MTRKPEFRYSIDRNSGDALMAVAASASGSRRQPRHSRDRVSDKTPFLIFSTLFSFFVVFSTSSSNFSHANMNTMNSYHVHGPHLRPGRRRSMRCTAGKPRIVFVLVWFGRRRRRWSYLARQRSFGGNIYESLSPHYRYWGDFRLARFFTLWLWYRMVRNLGAKNALTIL